MKRASACKLTYRWILPNVMSPRFVLDNNCTVDIQQIECMKTPMLCTDIAFTIYLYNLVHLASRTQTASYEPNYTVLRDGYPS